MLGKNAKKFVFSSLLVVGFGSTVSFAVADTVNIDTFAGSGWTVTRVSNPPLVTDPTIGVLNVASASLPSSWIDQSTINAQQTAKDGLPHAAQWVSDASDGGGQSDVNGQEYVYQDIFTLASSFTGDGAFSLSGTVSSDNWIPTPSSPQIPGGIPFTDGITLSYNPGTGIVTLPVSLTGGAELGQESMYHYAFDAALDPDFTSQTVFTLSVDVVNSFEDPTNGQNPGLTGLILAGTAFASAVPLPSTAGLGLSMLGVVGGFGFWRSVKRRIVPAV